jgi:membrane associated rhomboid family serine protease
LIELSREATDMLLDAIFFIAFCLILALQALFFFVPLGNENSTVRRLPWVTFTLMAGCVMAFYVTLPSTVEQNRQLVEAVTKLQEFLIKNKALLADEAVRKRLQETGVIDQDEADQINKEINTDAETEAQFKLWLRGADAALLRVEFDKLMAEYKAATEAHLYYKYGFAPNGNWKVHQLITHMFMHGHTLHLFGNLIFFFAVGFSLEDLWGRGTFLGFYILGGLAAALPSIISPDSVPSIGASGAISAAMGAFLIRLYNSKIKIGWITLPLAIPLLLFGRKPFGVIHLRAYIFLPFYFICQIVPWYIYSRAGVFSGTAYSAHIAGFVFGVAFALFMKASRAEEIYINPKIEAKVSFSASPVVTHALEMMDRGETAMAERKLRTHLMKNGNDVDALLALIQVYQRAENYDQLNVFYGRLIHYYLAQEDKEAALYAYDNLLSSFPDNHLDVRIPARDWLVLCEYLREAEMNREAAVEYERLANAYPDDALSARACVQGGEAALVAFDPTLALRLFEKAAMMNPPSTLATRIESGLEKCRRRLDNGPRWVKQPPTAPTIARGTEDSDQRWKSS